MKPVIDLFKMYVNGDTICIQNDELISEEIYLPLKMTSVVVRWKVQHFTELNFYVYASNREQILLKVRNLPFSGEYEFHLEQYSMPLYIGIVDKDEYLKSIEINYESKTNWVRSFKGCFYFIAFFIIFIYGLNNFHLLWDYGKETFDNSISEHQFKEVYKEDGYKFYRLGEDTPFTGTIKDDTDEYGRFIKYKIKNGEVLEETGYHKEGRIYYNKIGTGSKQFYDLKGNPISRNEYNLKYHPKRDKH